MVSGDRAEEEYNLLVHYWWLVEAKATAVSADRGKKTEASADHRKGQLVSALLVARRSRGHGC